MEKWKIRLNPCFVNGFQFLCSCGVSVVVVVVVVDVVLVVEVVEDEVDRDFGSESWPNNSDIHALVSSAISLSLLDPVTTEVDEWRSPIGSC